MSMALYFEYMRGGSGGRCVCMDGGEDFKAAAAAPIGEKVGMWLL